MCYERYTLAGSGDGGSILGVDQQDLEERKRSLCMMLQEVQETIAI